MKAAQHQNNFHFLRLCFASMVILSHSSELLDGNRERELLTRFFRTVSFGEVGVDGFFLLSGFLIAQSWQRNPKTSDFIIKRVLRIYPAYIIACILSVFVVGALGANDAYGYWRSLHLGEFVRDTLFLRRVTTPPTFSALPYPAVNNSLWTIRYEFLCYLALALLGVCGLTKKREAALFLAAVPAGVYLFECWHIGLLPMQHSALRLTAFFAVGVCFHLFSDHICYSRKGAVVAGLALATSMFHPVLSQAALLTAGAYLLFSAAFAQNKLLQQFKKRADISYGMYLYAWPITTLLVWHMPGISPWLLFALTWMCSGWCGWISWQLIERPFLRMKPRSQTELATLAQGRA